MTFVDSYHLKLISKVTVVFNSTLVILYKGIYNSGSNHAKVNKSDHAMWNLLTNKNSIEGNAATRSDSGKNVQRTDALK